MVNQKMRVHCNASVVSINKMDTLEGHGLVWYDADGIATILLIYRVSARFKNTAKLWRVGGSCREFGPGGRGLYYLDTMNTSGVALTGT